MDVAVGLVAILDPELGMSEVGVGILSVGNGWRLGLPPVSRLLTRVPVVSGFITDGEAGIWAIPPEILVVLTGTER